MDRLVLFTVYCIKIGGNKLSSSRCIILFLKSISNTRTQPKIPPWEITQIISPVREPILAGSVEPVLAPHNTSVSSNHCWFGGEGGNLFLYFAVSPGQI